MARAFSRSGIYLACTGLLALAACGGGGSGGGGGGLLPFAAVPPAPAPASAPPPGPVTVSGKVFVVGSVVNATVCVDRNLNNVCDADEPVSAKTGADGAFSITYTPADAAAATALAAAPLVAQIVPGTRADGASYDSTEPVDTLTTVAYSLSAPAGKTAQINPLTTLVQTGVASGLTLARAEAAVALQLGVAAADLYDYQAIALADVGADNARTMAGVTSFALSSGAALNVVDTTVAAAPVPTSQLAALAFTDPSNYSAQTYPTDGVVDATGKLHLVDTRVGLTTGAPTPHNTLYAQVRLTPSGWLRCDETSNFDSTLGSPSRSDYCGAGSPSVSFSVPQDISGTKLADVVTAIQALPNPSITGLNPAAAFADPAAVFPAGSQLRMRTGLNLTQPYFINNTNTDVAGGGFTTLAALIAGRPVSGVNLTNGNGTFSLGLKDNTHLLRGAFIDAATVQYYACDSVGPAYATMSNCVNAGTGAYRVDTVAGVKVLALDLAGYPVTTANHQRTLAEYSGAVYLARKTRPEVENNLSVVQRINGVAFDALKAQIGL